MLNRIGAPVKCRARKWHSGAWEDRAIGVRAATVQRFGPLDCEREFTAQNFHAISTDTHSDHLVILFRGANKNATGTMHLEALLDQNPLIAERCR